MARAGIPPRAAGRLSGQPQGGSCIFIHLRLPGKTGTSGCVALAAPDLDALHDYVQAGAVLALLPRQALNRFKGCLPEAARP
jgi:hypothetical protein